MASYDENKDFMLSLGLDNLLDEAIDFIKGNLNPEEVFDLDTLEIWASANGYVEKE